MNAEDLKQAYDWALWQYHHKVSRRLPADSILSTDPLGKAKREILVKMIGGDFSPAREFPDD